MESSPPIAVGQPPAPAAGAAPPMHRPHALVVCLWSALLAGMAVAVTWLIVLFVSFVDDPRVNGALGVQWSSGEELTATARVVRSALAPWSAQVTMSGGEAVRTLSRLNLYAMLLAVAVVILVGYATRRLTGPSLRRRALALSVATLTAAAGVGLAAWQLTYTLGSTQYSHRFSAYFVATLVIYAAAGAFSYGVLSALPPRLGIPIRDAWLLVVLASLVVGLTYPFAVSAAAQDELEDEFAFGNASLWSATVGSMAVPLGTFGEASFTRTTNAGIQPSPLYVGTSEGRRSIVYAWPALQGYLETNPSFRVVDLGGAGGDGGRIASLVWPVLFLLLWTTGIASGYRRLRVSRVRDGALLGGIAAAAAALMLLAVTQLGALRTTWRVRDELLGAGFSGVRIDEAMISAGVLAALAVALGIVGAAVRGARRRRAPAVAAAPGAPTSTALPQAASFCPSCGAAYGSDQERFCGGCGRPRSPVRPVTPE